MSGRCGVFVSSGSSGQLRGGSGATPADPGELSVLIPGRGEQQQPFVPALPRVEVAGTAAYRPRLVTGAWAGIRRGAHEPGNPHISADFVRRAHRGQCAGSGCVLPLGLAGQPERQRLEQIVQVILDPGRTGIRVGVVLVLGQPVLDLRDRQWVPGDQEWFDAHIAYRLGVPGTGEERVKSVLGQVSVRSASVEDRGDTRGVGAQTYDRTHPHDRVPKVAYAYRNGLPA